MYVQERELTIMLPDTTVSFNAPRRNMDKPLWQLSLCVDDGAELTIDYKHSKWEFPITAKVHAASVDNKQTCVCSIFSDIKDEKYKLNQSRGFLKTVTMIVAGSRS